MDISREIELLCHCATTHQMAGRLNAHDLCNQAVDWEALTRLARQHRVHLLVYRQLQQLGTHWVPQEVNQQLANLVRFNAICNVRLLQELVHLLQLFESKQIIAIPFKGPVLAMMAYGDLSLRQFGDLDILIPREQMLSAQGLLLAEGYVQQRKGRELNLAHEKLLDSQYRYDEWYWKTLNTQDGFGARVELHWSTSPQHIIFPMHPEHLWAHVQPFTIAGTTISNLHPADLVLMLCINYSKDHWRYLRMICDIAALCDRNPQLDWEQMLQEAQYLGRTRALLLGLNLTHQVLAAPLPDVIAARIQADSAIARLTQNVRQRLFCNNGSEPSLSTKIPYNFQLREQLSDKFRYGFFSLLKMLDKPNDGLVQP